MMNPGPQVITYLFGNKSLPVTDTLLVSWLVVIVTIIAAKLITYRLKMRPGPVQNAAEFFLQLIEDQVEPMLPGEGRKFLPFIATIFIYVGIGNLIGVLPGIPSPTGDLNLTLGLGLIVFLISHFEGMREKGVWGYFKGFTEPVFFLLPLNIVSELAKPISHSFRLFGNIVGGGIIITLIYQVAPGLIPIPLHVWFDLFVGAIQALIFGMVAIAYISVAKS